jgi:hypothetical protein
VGYRQRGSRARKKRHKNRWYLSNRVSFGIGGGAYHTNTYAKREMTDLFLLKK